MDLKIARIVDTTPCADHNAVGEPCFEVPRLAGRGFQMGICGKRAKKAGMNGRISPGSLTMIRRG